MRWFIKGITFAENTDCTRKFLHAVNWLMATSPAKTCSNCSISLQRNCLQSRLNHKAWNWVLHTWMLKDALKNGSRRSGWDFSRSSSEHIVHTINKITLCHCVVEDVCCFKVKITVSLAYNQCIFINIFYIVYYLLCLMPWKKSNNVFMYLFVV